MLPELRIGALLLCLGCGWVVPAEAAEPGWYALGFGGEATASGVNQSRMDENLVTIFESAGLTVVDAASTLDDSDTGFGLAGGYQVNDHFAVEFAYVELGSVEYEASATVSDGTEDFAAELGLGSEADGPVVSMLGILPIGERFSLYGRAGLSFMTADGTLRVALDDVSQRASQSSQKFDPVFGAGAELSLGKYFAIRLAWDRYLDVGTEDVTGDVDTDLFSLGLRMGLGWFR